MQSQENALQTVDREMELALFKIKLSEPVLQRKILIKLRNEISLLIESLNMPEERKNYLLHQLVNAQDVDLLVELMTSVNGSQLQDKTLKQIDLIYIAQTSQGISVTKKSIETSANVNSENALKQKLQSLSNKHSAAVIGTTSEEMTAAALVAATEVDELILLHHSPLEVSIKLQKVLTTIFKKIVDFPSDSTLVSAVKRHWHNGASVTQFLAIPEIKNVIMTTTDLNMVYEADIILCGNCPTSSFLKHSQFKPNAVLIDMTSNSVITEHLALMTNKRPDLTVFSHKEHN